MAIQEKKKRGIRSSQRGGEIGKTLRCWTKIKEIQNREKRKKAAFGRRKGGVKLAVERTPNVENKGGGEV